ASSPSGRGQGEGLEAAPSRSLQSNSLETLTPALSQREREFIQISVADTGVGIAPEDQARIFEEFQQSRSAPISANAEGTGLGLTLAKRFVELHRGRIWVESVVG